MRYCLVLEPHLRYTVCCSVVQFGAVHCSAFQSDDYALLSRARTAPQVHSVLQFGAVWCSVVQCGAVCCSVLQSDDDALAVCCSALQSDDDALILVLELNLTFTI